MSRKAVVRGEFHISNVDRKALLNRDLTDFQALYLEGRSNVIRLHKHTNSYILYLIGYFFLELIYTTTSIIHKRLLPLRAIDIEREARNKGLEVNAEIDLEIDEIYENISARVVHSSLAIFLIAFFLTFWRAFYEETINLVWVSTAIPYWILPLVIGVLLPLGYSGLLLIFGGEGERDEEMVASIDSITEERGHEAVLILVGDAHVELVGDKLKERGWEVKKERSTHPIPRISRFLSEYRDSIV